MFRKADLDRYARQIILPGVGASGQARLAAARVLVVGAGGLGAPVLLYLAAAGVGALGVVDDDTVALSNLQRQVLYGVNDLGRPKVAAAAERLAALNPDVKLGVFEERLSRGQARERVREYDLVMDGSDSFATRYLVNDACVLEGRPLVYGALSSFEGQLSLLHHAGGPCYRCLFPQPPAPGSVPNCAEAGVLGALPGVLGSLMALEALKLLLGLGAPLSGVLLHFDGLEAETHRVQVARNPACAVCGDAPSIRDLIDYEAFCGLS